MKQGVKRGTLGVLLAGMMLTALSGPALAGNSTFQYTVGPVRIPDGHGSARLGFDFIAPPGASVTAIRPNFRVRHRQTRQLRLFIKGPDGTKVLLSDHETHGRNLGEDQCGSDGLVLGYTGFWDNDTFADSLDEDSAPYVGFFLPHDSLAGFEGQSFGGHWSVIVKDTKRGKRGVLKCGLMSVLYV